jgi:hypothetical protein
MIHFIYIIGGFICDCMPFGTHFFVCRADIGASWTYHDPNQCDEKAFPLVSQGKEHQEVSNIFTLHINDASDPSKLTRRCAIAEVRAYELGMFMVS